MNELQLEISRFLAARAREGRLATYQELAAAVRWPHPTGRGIGNNLYVVLTYVHELQLPPLTTILVKKGERYPSRDALTYIREVTGEIDIPEAQGRVFAYDWGSHPEFRLITDELPGGPELWQQSLKGPSFTDIAGRGKTFLLKFNGELNGPQGIARPQEVGDWDDQVLRMPWRVPRASSLSDKSPGPHLAVGDILYLWVHEDEEFGFGQGLTGIAKAKRITSAVDELHIQLGDLALLKRPFGFRHLSEGFLESGVLKKLKDDPRPRAWNLSNEERIKLDQIITEMCSRGSASLEAAELAHLSVLERALNEHHDEVIDAERKRKTAIAKARPEQWKFREQAMERHGGRCVVTGASIAAVLDAAHVIPHTGNDEFEVPENSLVLRRDIHALFDACLIAINPKSARLVLAPELASSPYRELAGRTIHHKLASAPLVFQYTRFKRANS
ncbi:HNH endonuclease [Histidinibacterium aquaticum]|uniref:HNH endonuclease n=1 Tax=Histidinibacterium aquaticum TaxID=2613962 RepID=A0A5J5GQ11_9RHOB|nr:HNH endonuclease signature motif containing protein [Histidinibacterium aquaticum]KAA9010331.1 HNH endonuclease [Histidinibacterium aquaticum]